MLTPTAQHNTQPTTAAPLLRTRSPGVSVAGKIRAGIQALSPQAHRSGLARSIYEKGMRVGMAYEEIEQRLQQAVPGLDQYLVPQNVGYFSARACDFEHPGLAAELLDRYGEVGADGVRRLYRFPVVFVADTWQQAMPHQLISWDGRERRFWSEYSEDGKRRYCMERTDFDGTARGLGARRQMLRSDNAGVCNPQACPEYQARLCRLQGRFVFAIPGIRSSRPFSVSTNSLTAMQQAVDQFEVIKDVRGGRLSGLIGGRTPFMMSKRQVPMEVPGPDGEPITKPQWVITVDADVDLTELMQSERDVGRRLARAGAAVQALEFGMGSSVISIANGKSAQRASPAEVVDAPEDRAVAAPEGPETIQHGSVHAQAPMPEGQPIALEANVALNETRARHAATVRPGYQSMLTTLPRPDRGMHRVAMGISAAWPRKGRGHGTPCRRGG